jgi:TPR repeat protein
MVLQLKELYDSNIDVHKETKDEFDEEKNEEIMKIGEEFKKSAQEGNAQDQCILGICFRFGIIFEMDIEESVQWFEKAVEQNDLMAKFNLGGCYFDGEEGVKQDIEKGLRLLEEAANENEVNSQSTLGLCYLNGIGVTKDYHKAIDWFKKCLEVDKKNEVALTGMAEIQMNGLGVPKNPEKAAFCYETLAKGNSEAQSQLAQLYKDGVEEDIQKCIKLLTDASKSQHLEAINLLGFLYYKGKQIPQDYQKAKDWFEYSGKLGSDISQYNLGKMYQKGLGVDQSDEMAITWYKLAADSGHAMAAYQLGMILSKSTKKSDLRKSVDYFKKASDLGNVNAHIRVGKYYWDGVGVSQNPSKALACFLKAASEGNPEGQYRVGLCYELGSGAPQDDRKAIDWYNKSANQDFPEGQMALGLFLQEGRGIEKNPRRGFQYIQKAAKQGCAEAQYYLGLSYEESIGVTGSDEKALEYYTKAAKQDYADVQKAIDWFTKASSQKHDLAQLSLGDIYLDMKEYEDALYWFDQAKKNGNQEAAKSDLVKNIL